MVACWKRFSRDDVGSVLLTLGVPEGGTIAKSV